MYAPYMNTLAIEEAQRKIDPDFQMGKEPAGDRIIIG